MRSHAERRCSFLGPTQSRISPSVLQHTKIDPFWSFPLRSEAAGASRLRWAHGFSEAAIQGYLAENAPP